MTFSHDSCSFNSCFIGKPRYVIRALADGTQLKLHAATGEIIERFGINPQTGKPAHYKKLADEAVQLVPGDPKLVEACA